MKQYVLNVFRTKNLCNIFDIINKLQKKGFAQKVNIISTNEYYLVMINSKCSSASSTDVYNRVKEIVKTCLNALTEE